MTQQYFRVFFLFLLLGSSLLSQNSSADQLIMGSFSSIEYATREQLRLTEKLGLTVTKIADPSSNLIRLAAPDTPANRKILLQNRISSWRLVSNGPPKSIAIVTTVDAPGSNKSNQKKAAAEGQNPATKPSGATEPINKPADNAPLATSQPDVATQPISKPVDNPLTKITSTTSVKTKTNTKSKKSQKTEKSFYVPPGFENLLEPQTTQVDIYYGGAYLLSTLATFTPNNIQFLTPTEVLKKIPGVIAQALILEKLTTELESNNELICYRRNQTGCGQIEPTDVAVIFDESRFRADIFIAPELLNIQGGVINKFLPPSQAGLSLLNVTGATFNGALNGTEDFNFANSTTIAFRETRLFAISNVTKTEDLTIDTLALQREFNGKQIQAGIFRSSPSSTIFIRESDFLGFSYSSSLNTRKDLDQSSGNTIQVFLNSRSRVDILKDDRLISTGVYDTGNQILDTSRMPGGSYEVVLRIRDNFGSVKEETRFYSKTNLLPPADQPLFYFDIGEQVEKVSDEVLPEKNGRSILRAGYSKRLNDNFGGDIGFIADDEQALLETGLFFLGRQHDLRFNVGIGENDEYGGSIIANARIGFASINARIMKTWSNGPDALIGPPSTQGNINVSIPFDRSAISFSARYNQRAGDSEENFGMRYDFPSFNFASQPMYTDLQVTKDNGEWLILLSARLAISGDHWNTDISSRAFHENTPDQPKDNGFINSVATSWRDGDRYQSDLRWSMRAVDDRVDKTIESEFELGSRLGRLNMDVVHSLENDVTSYGANFYTTIIANKDTFSIGGKTQALSAVVLDIEGDVKDAFFKVNVNRLHRDNATIGKKTVVSLPPYETYSFSLTPAGDSLISFNDQIKDVTLYPGNVVTLKWNANRILVAFGQIVDIDNKPIQNALIKGVVGIATTDEFGLFQAEVESNITSLEVKTRASSCTVEIPEFDSSGMLVRFDQLVCR